MGTPADLIGFEYTLSRVGAEPFRTKMHLPSVLRSIGGVVIAAGEDPEKLLQLPGAREFLSLSAEVMADFVIHVREKYGGAQGYLQNRLGLAELDIAAIKQNLASKA